MKKIVAGILILVLVLGLVACGESSNNGGGNDTNLTRVENVEVSLRVFTDTYRTGTYSGEVLDGVPHGEGVFTTYNAQGIRWTYTGGFVDGLFQGNGVMEWETGRREEGYYQYGYLFSGRIYDEDGDLLLEMENGLMLSSALVGAWEHVEYRLLEELGFRFNADGSGTFFEYGDILEIIWRSGNGVLTVELIEYEIDMVFLYSITGTHLTLIDDNDWVGEFVRVG